MTHVDDSSKEYLDTLDTLISEAINRRGAIGIVLGILISREILERSGEAGAEAAQVIHRDSVNEIIPRVASGDIILQDQIMTGNPYDPEIDKTFREIADMYEKSRP